MNEGYWQKIMLEINSSPDYRAVVDEYCEKYNLKSCLNLKIMKMILLLDTSISNTKRLRTARPFMIKEFLKLTLIPSSGF